MPNVRDMIEALNHQATLQHKPTSSRRDAWVDLRQDIMQGVVELLGPRDVQSAMLVCREWRRSTANGLLVLRPRLLQVNSLATR